MAREDDCARFSMKASIDLKPVAMADLISVYHCVSRLQGLHNVVIQRSKMLCLKARTTGLPLIRDIFTEAPSLSYTSFGFNLLNSIMMKL